jgi:hypothetical protein
MYCRNCGSQINDNAVVCVNCGCAVQAGQGYQQNYQQNYQQPYQQPYQQNQPYGQPYQQPVNPYAPMDAPSTGMAILGFFIPLAGFIIWLINKDTKPQMAKSAGKGALSGFIFVIVFYGLIYGLILGGLLSDMWYYM